MNLIILLRRFLIFYYKSLLFLLLIGDYLTAMRIFHVSQILSKINLVHFTNSALVRFSSSY